MGTLYWIAEKSFLPDNSDYLIGVHVISIIVTCADSVSSSIDNSDYSVDDATYCDVRRLAVSDFELGMNVIVLLIYCTVLYLDFA